MALPAHDPDRLQPCFLFRAVLRYRRGVGLVSVPVPGWDRVGVLRSLRKHIEHRNALASSQNRIEHLSSEVRAMFSGWLPIGTGAPTVAVPGTIATIELPGVEEDPEPRLAIMYWNTGHTECGSLRA